MNQSWWRNEPRKVWTSIVLDSDKLTKDSEDYKIIENFFQEEESYLAPHYDNEDEPEPELVEEVYDDGGETKKVIYISKCCDYLDDLGDEGEENNDFMCHIKKRKNTNIKINVKGESYDTKIDYIKKIKVRNFQPDNEKEM